MHTVTPATGSNVSATDAVVFAASLYISPELHPLSVATVDVCCRCFAVRLAGMDSYSPRGAPRVGSCGVGIMCRGRVGQRERMCSSAAASGIRSSA